MKPVKLREGIRVVFAAVLGLAMAKPLGLPALAAEPEPKQAVAPAVVSTSPQALANDVDPALDRITVTFDQAMMDHSWSWTGGGETYPKITGEIRYDAAKKTCTLPVKLEPGKAYWVGVNSPSHRNFKTPARIPTPWYLIVFATKSADGKPTPIPEEMLARAKRINAPAIGKKEPEPKQGDVPAVVKTSPPTMANDVDPALDRITVTFDRAMMDKSWSWTGGGETYPKITGEIGYDAAKTTCTLPVKLEPGRAYWVGVNSPSHRNFKTSARIPTPWYVIVFATKSADGKPTPIPEDMLARAKRINAPANGQKEP